MADRSSTSKVGRLNSIGEDPPTSNVNDRWDTVRGNIYSDGRRYNNNTVESDGGPGSQSGGKSSVTSASTRTAHESKWDRVRCAVMTGTLKNPRFSEAPRRQLQKPANMAQVIESWQYTGCFQMSVALLGLSSDSQVAINDLRKHTDFIENFLKKRFFGMTQFDLPRQAKESGWCMASWVTHISRFTTVVTKVPSTNEHEAWQALGPTALNCGRSRILAGNVFGTINPHAEMALAKQFGKELFTIPVALRRPVVQVCCRSGFAGYLLTNLAGLDLRDDEGRHNVYTFAGSTCNFVSEMQGLSSIVKLSSGGKHMFAVDEDGAVWTWTDPLTKNIDEKRSPITRVEGLEDMQIRTVAACSRWVAAVSMEGEVYTWRIQASRKLPGQHALMKRLDEDEGFNTPGLSKLRSLISEPAVITDMQIFGEHAVALGRDPDGTAPGSLYYWGSRIAPNEVISIQSGVSLYAACTLAVSNSDSTRCEIYIVTQPPYNAEGIVPDSYITHLSISLRDDIQQKQHMIGAAGRWEELYTKSHPSIIWVGQAEPEEEEHAPNGRMVTCIDAAHGRCAFVTIPKFSHNVEIPIVDELAPEQFIF